MRRSIPIYLILLILSACSSGKQALKLIEKEKFEKARTSLDKALPKDSLNADLYYVYSLLFTDTAYSAYNIDSSYFYILKAQNDFSVTDQKLRSKYQKQLGLDSLTLMSQRLLNDSLAYERASDIHSVQAYQYFLDQHPEAPQTEEATQNRNQLAYRATSQLDTYEAYKTFMEKYPDAKEYELAKERYNTLVFRDKTRSGDLQGYIDFLESFPDSPFRAQAERQVLEISTADNQLENYERFIRRYPKSPSIPLAVNLLYHLYKDRFSAASFFEKYPNIPLLDSLKKAHKLEEKILAPVFEDQHYGLMDSQGELAIRTQYDYIPNRYLCEGVEAEIVHLAQLISEKEQHQLLTKAGESIFNFERTAERTNLLSRMDKAYFYPLGAGVSLARTQNDLFTLLFQSGEILLPNAKISSLLDTAALLPFNTSEAESAQQPAYQFIKYQVDGLWGIVTFTGKVLLEPEYEEIEVLEEFVLIRKNGRLAVTKRELVADVANQRPLELSFLYEDASMLDDEHIIAYTDDYESVIDKNLEIVVPLDKHNVIRKIKGADQEGAQWLLRENRVEAYVKNDSLLNRTVSAYYLYDKSGESEKSTTYRNASFSSNWLAMKAKDDFLFYNLNNSSSAARYDSVKLIGENFALQFKYFTEGKDSVAVIFPNERRLALAAPEDIDFLLLEPSQISADREYLLIAPKSGPKEVWSQYGRRIMMDRFDDLKIYGPGLFVIEKNRRKGLLDSLGNELLPIKYESISNYRDSLIAVFQNSKFGAYDYATGSLINPRYDAALQAYGSSVFQPEDSTYSRLYIAREGGQYGLINAEEDKLSSFEYEQLRYWNDTSALVRQNDNWSIVRFNRKEPYDEEKNYLLYSGIEELEALEMSTDESWYRIYKEQGYGVISNQHGELLTPAYDDIRLLGNISDPNSIFLAEKYVPEAELYIVIHLNTSGEIIKRQALTSEQYDKIYCDD